MVLVYAYKPSLQAEIGGSPNRGCLDCLVRTVLRHLGLEMKFRCENLLFMSKALGSNPVLWEEGGEKAGA